jgi:hypothetical protein
MDTSDYEDYIQITDSLSEDLWCSSVSVLRYIGSGGSNLVCRTTGATSKKCTCLRNVALERLCKVRRWPTHPPLLTGPYPYIEARNEPAFSKPCPKQRERQLQEWRDLTGFPARLPTAFCAPELLWLFKYKTQTNVLYVTSQIGASGPNRHQ